MTTEELEFLKTPAAREAINKYIDTDPARAAMQLRGEFGSFASTLATQIKYLERAKTKIPSFYLNRCIIEPLAFEQSSSSVVSQTKEYSGALCLDLTCGLGVDVINFAGRFDKVITVERNELLVDIARYNFSLLGIDNVEIRLGDSEVFVSEYAKSVVSGDAPKADLLYADPARRDSAGKKTVGFASCSPDIVPMLDSIEACTRRVVVKCSPLFEVSELFAVFGEQGVEAQVVSSRAECKEVVVDRTFGCQSKARVQVISSELGHKSFDLGYSHDNGAAFALPYKYMLLPDVAMYKARMVESYVRSLGEDAFIDSQNGYGFTNELPANFFGRVFEIETMEVFKAKKVKKDLSLRGIKRATLMQHNMNMSNDALAKSMSISIGGDNLIAFTRIKQESYIVFIGKKL